MTKTLKIALILLLFALLAAIRYFEEYLFYDPLNFFFEVDYLKLETLPDLDRLKLMFSVSIRYWLNSLLSLLILWIAFQEKGVIWFSMVVYVCLYLFLVLVFYFLVQDYDSGNYLFLFYVRRFLIQPLLLIILLPAFYYQRSLEK